MIRKKLPGKGIPHAIGIGWPTLMAGGVAAALLTALYSFKLGRLMVGGRGEIQTIETVASLSSIALNPLLALYKLPAWFMQQFTGLHPLTSGRLVSVWIALICVALFYLLARRWYGRLSGLGITVLFATSSWMLHTGRYAAGYGVLILIVLLLMNLVVWAGTSERSARVILITAFIGSLALYVPGGIWFLIAAILLSRKALRGHWLRISLQVRLASAAVFGLSAAIMTAAWVRNPDIIRQSFGLPTDFPGMIELIKQTALSAGAFVLRGPGTPEVWLSHTPILDVASLVLLLLGIAFYARHIRRPRIRLLLVFAVIGIILTALNGSAGLSFLVPIAYLVAGSGIAYLLHQWKKVFPRNPIAEAVAFSVIGVLLICIVTFHVQRYFIAWRYSPATAEAYRQAVPGSGQLPYLIQ